MSFFRRFGAEPRGGQPLTGAADRSAGVPGGTPAGGTTIATVAPIPAQLFSNLQTTILPVQPLPYMIPVPPPQNVRGPKPRETVVVDQRSDRPDQHPVAPARVDDQPPREVVPASRPPLVPQIRAQVPKSPIAYTTDGSAGGPNVNRPIERDIRPIERDIRPIERDIRPVERDIRPIERDVPPIERDIRPVERDVPPPPPPPPPYVPPDVMYYPPGKGGGGGGSAWDQREEPVSVDPVILPDGTTLVAVTTKTPYLAIAAAGAGGFLAGGPIGAIVGAAIGYFLGKPKEAAVSAAVSAYYRR